MEGGINDHSVVTIGILRDLFKFSPQMRILTGLWRWGEFEFKITFGVVDVQFAVSVRARIIDTVRYGVRRHIVLGNDPGQLRRWQVPGCDGYVDIVFHVENWRPVAALESQFPNRRAGRCRGSQGDRSCHGDDNKEFAYAFFSFCGCLLAFSGHFLSWW